MNGENASVLVGNGLSVAFNRGLALQSITQEVLKRMEAASGGDVVLAMKEIAENALPDGATSGEDFEILVGAFGAEARTLGFLGQLAELTRPAEAALRESIRTVAEFAEQVRDTGISYVLEVISERSRSNHQDGEPLRRLLKTILTAFPGRVVVGNLNYDTLLLAAALESCKDDLADMGHGFKNVNFTKDGQLHTVSALRESVSDFPEYKRVQLLHLHGSLTFWANRDGSAYAKLTTDLLRDGSQWKAVREQATDIRPVVVLANKREKTEHVKTFPFCVAYDAFALGLSRSEHWLVIGYSFRDDPVNSMLREEFIRRVKKPRVLVVTLGTEPTLETVERAFGWGAEDGSSESWLVFDRAGAADLDLRPTWATFVG